jgi:preprotein translocase subunit SecA
VSSPSAALPWRPGFAAGAVPERPDEPEAALAAGLRALAGWLSVPRRARRRDVAAFAARVARVSTDLAACSDARFDAALAELRAALRRRGLCEELWLRGFGLVREGARRTLGTPHYDVQLYGGWILAQRGLAEMETGEGKTLTATLPACVAALAGIPVHVVTANDYLALRDGAALRPLYARLGLTIGTVHERVCEPTQLRAAYACDVTYATAKQLAFDYLRDRLAAASERWPRAPGACAEPRNAPLLRGLCFAILDEADSLLIDEARMPLILSRPAQRAGIGPRGADGPPGAREALRVARALEPGVDFRLDRRRSDAELTPRGRVRARELASALDEALGGERCCEEWLRRALTALHLFECDRHYLVRDGAVQIIDLPTGRRAPDRAFEGAMHALIEAKEGLALTPARETAARISHQRFFRRYLRLAGMTGTAREVAHELWRTYGLRTVRVPTRRPLCRVDHGTRVLPNVGAKWQALVERIRELHATRRPVLVGTASVAASEELSGLLHVAGLPHEVLNARQDAEEARIVAQAGQAGRITVATRMAGRGTDIQLGPGVAEAGGLAVLAAELGDERRIDRQLFGRAGRQGVPGSHERWLSLDEALPAAHLGAWMRRVLAARQVPEAPRAALIRWAQLAEERRGARARRRLLVLERELDELLAFSGRSE